MMQRKKLWFSIVLVSLSVILIVIGSLSSRFYRLDSKEQESAKATPVENKWAASDWAPVNNAYLADCPIGNVPQNRVAKALLEKDTRGHHRIEYIIGLGKASVHKLFFEYSLLKRRQLIVEIRDVADKIGYGAVLFDKGKAQILKAEGLPIFATSDPISVITKKTGWSAVEITFYMATSRAVVDIGIARRGKQIFMGSSKRGACITRLRHNRIVSK